MKKFIIVFMLMVFPFVAQASVMTVSESEQGLPQRPEKAGEDYLNAIKITFLSWSSGSSKVSYERAFPSVKQSGEICAGMIGAGYDKYHNRPLGFTLRYGHKFFIADRDPYSLRGFFVRPELVWSRYFYDRQTDGARTLSSMVSLLATAGYQWTYRRFIADFWVGAGYADGSYCDTYYHHGFQLWNWFGVYNPNIALSFSIRVGLCF